MMNTSGGLGSVTAVTKPQLSWDCGEFWVNELAAQRFEAFERPLLTAPISREYPATSAARIAARRPVWLMFPHRRTIWGRSPKRALRSRGCTRSHMMPGRERAAGAGGGGCNELYADYGRPGTNGGDALYSRPPHSGRNGRWHGRRWHLPKRKSWPPIPIFNARTFLKHCAMPQTRCVNASCR